MIPPVLLVCHSTRPRGGLVHTLSLGEALLAQGVDVRLVAIGDPAAGLFRPTALPHTIVPSPPPGETLEERVFAAVDALEAGLSLLCPPGPVVLHAQDCIAARAACRIRDGHALTGPRPGGTFVVRTVHHVDDFTTPALIECQQRAILDPDRLLVVSEHWRKLLADGLRRRRHRRPQRRRPATASAQANAGERAAVPGPGRRRARHVPDPDGWRHRTPQGIDHPARGDGRARSRANGAGPRPVLAVVGGHTFFDYRAYRDNALARLPELGLVEGRDILLLGTVSEADLGAWYRAADAFAFPSVKEGFGLVVLEALAAGLPVVASDIPVFAEYLRDGESALLVPPGDPAALAGALGRLAGDPLLRRRLAAGGQPLVDRFTWAASASAHRDIYTDATKAAAVGSPVHEH